MNLHDIQSPMTRLVWLTPVGRNRALIGRGNRRGMHLYWTTRTTPPDTYYRRYWYPWVTPATDPKEPVCGTIQTTSRWPRFTYWTETRCPDCVRIGGTNATNVDLLNATDPWAFIPRDQRDNTPDPVTGL